MKSRQQKDGEKHWRKRVSRWNNDIKQRGSDTRIDLVWCLSFKECCYCGDKLVASNASLDHKLARSQGGKDELVNLHLVCKSCNRSKGSLSHQQFILLLDFLSKPPFTEREKWMIHAKMRLGWRADRG